MNFKNIYNTNDDARLYVDRYCTTYRIPVDVALTHSLVQWTLAMYEKKKRARGDV